MQRFKNLTKKSGKVASAILSAAMVTSMVLGTNVVEVKAATEDTETTADAQTTVNTEVEVAREARTYFQNRVKKYPVNAATTEGEIGFAEAIQATQDHYSSDTVTTTVSGLTFKVTKNPSVSKEGKMVLEFKVEANGHTESGKVEYTLDSLDTRASKMKDAVDKKLADWSPSNVTEGALKATVADKIYELKDETESGLKLYGDFNFAGFSSHGTNGITNVNLEPATKNGDGSFSASITVPAASAGDCHGIAGKNAVTSIDKTIDSNQKRVDAAKTTVEKYLQSNPRRFGKSATTSTAIGAVNDYLARKEYTDASIAADKGVKFAIKDAANRTTEGSASIDTFRLTVGTGTEQATADVTATTVTLWSDKSIATKGLQDLLDTAAKVSVSDGTINSTTTAALSYQLKLTKALNNKEDGLAVYLPTSVDFDYDSATSYGATGFKELYTNDVSAAKVEYIPEDAAADKDGQPRAIFTVTCGDETATDTYTYTLDSVQTSVDKAGKIVEEALNNMTVTNDTTQEDVKKVINDTLVENGYIGIGYGVYNFDKHDATADKEGTLTYGVVIQDKKNGMVREFNVERKIVFRSNTFVVENGKKFYYDKNGNLLKNTFLQGTDSPDGYTYYIQNDGSVMQDRLTYHPNGKDVIYFDADGHEVFDAFVNVKKDVQGNAVDYIGYFGTLGGAYVNQTTYGNGVGAYSKDALFYINDYGVLENKGWFQNAAGNIGYAAPNGTLTTSQWSLDQFGRKVYFQANGFLAKGLMTDGVKTYQLDETDGHLVGEF